MGQVGPVVAALDDMLDEPLRLLEVGLALLGFFGAVHHALFRSIRVEARIGQQAESADFEEIRRAAEVGDLGFHGIPSLCGLVWDERERGVMRPSASPLGCLWRWFRFLVWSCLLGSGLTRRQYQDQGAQ